MSGLVFTIAQNGYDLAYSRCVRTHAAYAARIGAAHVVVTEPARVESPAFSAWLKVPLVLQGLKAGYDGVAYIDADCEVRADAPDFRTIGADSDATVFMANGRSGRLNSGVIFARQSPSAIEFFSRVMTSLTESIPAEDRANLKYENGNIIYCAKTATNIEILPTEWNNTFDPALKDNIRHYTGPLRDEYKRPVSDSVKVWFHKLTMPKPTKAPEARDQAFVDRLSSLVDGTITAYPAFRSVA